jgi:adenosylcobinamide-GDP ribazoletransferase
VVIRALGFLTIVGRSAPPNPSTLRWFPFAGALIGAIVGGLWWGAAQLWSPALAAALVAAADLAITGMLHLDGLTDTADGVLPHLERSRRLAVMAEPTVGAFGVGVAVVVLLVRWAAFAALAPNVLLVGGLWCVARTAMAVTVRAVPYAREGGGLASAFVGTRSWFGLALVGSTLGLGLGFLAAGAGGAAAVVVATAAGAGVVALGVSRLGGYTGDVLGAAGMMAETIGLVVAAARW